jgi:hypothetical protein
MALAFPFVDGDALQADILAAAADASVWKPGNASRQMTTELSTPQHTKLVGGQVNVDPRRIPIICTAKAGYASNVFGLGTGYDFNGFPVAMTDEDGTIHVFLAHSANHAGVETVTAHFSSTDYGNTWTPVGIVTVPGVNGAVIYPELLYRIQNGIYAGRIILVHRFSVETPSNSYASYSDDEMVTWSASVSCTDLVAPMVSGNAGAAITDLADGTIVISNYSRAVSTYYITSFRQSTDGGVTWTQRCVIENGVGPGEKPEEPGLCLMANGEWLISVREDNTGTIRTYYSNDDLLTVNTIAGSTAGAVRGIGRPSLYSFENGVVVMFTRYVAADTFLGIAAGAPVFYTSGDYGRTWSAPRILHNHTGYMSYGAFFRAADNVVGLVYSVAADVGSGSLADDEYKLCDTFVTYLSSGDAVTPFGSRLGGVIQNPIVKDRLGLSIAAVRKAESNDATVLQTRLNALTEYMIKAGIMPRHPLDISSITGLWEADNIAQADMDWLGTFASVTSLARSSGETVAGTTDGGATWAVGAGKLSHSAASGNNTFWWEVGRFNGVLTAKVTWRNDGQVGILFRFGTGPDCYKVGADGSNIRLYKTDNNADTTLVTGTGVLVNGVEATFVITYVGASITVTLDGAACISHTLSGGDLAAILGTGIGVKTASLTATYDDIRSHLDLAVDQPMGYVADQSTGAAHMTQATSNLQPLYGLTNGLFGDKPYLRWTASTIKRLASTVFASQAQPNAVVFVGFFGVTTGAQMNFITSNNESGNTQNIGLTSAGKFQVNAGTPRDVGPTTNVWPIGPVIITVRFNTTDTIVRFNGREVYRSTASTTIGTSPLTQLTWGDGINVTDMSSPAMALFATGSPTEAELIDVEKYFADKYNIRIER